MKDVLRLISSSKYAEFELKTKPRPMKQGPPSLRWFRFENDAEQKRRLTTRGIIMTANSVTSRSKICEIDRRNSTNSHTSMCMLLVCEFVEFHRNIRICEFVEFRRSISRILLRKVTRSTTKHQNSHMRNFHVNCMVRKFYRNQILVSACDRRRLFSQDCHVLKSQIFHGTYMKTKIHTSSQ